MKILLLLISLEVITAIEVIDPLVAFRKDLPVVYRSNDGWVEDFEMKYTDDKRVILNYCKKRYPHLKVTNVMELSEEITINEWCPTKEPCSDSYNVAPYRCIDGPFPTLILAVPDGCRYHTIEHPEGCVYPKKMQSFALGKCSRQKRDLHKHSVMAPCGIDRFSRVEFVCCPTVKKHVPTLWSSVVGMKLPWHRVVIKKDPEETFFGETSSDRDGGSVSGDVYKKYISNSPIPSASDEYGRFKAAMEYVKFKGKQTMNMAIRAWNEAVHREIPALMNKKREDLALEESKKITMHFRNVIEDMKKKETKSEEDLRRRHMDHILKELTDKKTKALQYFMDVVDSDEPTVSEIVKSLRRYIAVEEKDKRRVLSRFQHTLERNSDAAKEGMDILAEHIRSINRRINKVLEYLQHLKDPAVVSEATRRIKAFLNSYFDLDVSVNSTILKDTALVATTETPDYVGDNYDDITDSVLVDNDEDSLEGDFEEDYSYADDDDVSYKGDDDIDLKEDEHIYDSSDDKYHAKLLQHGIVVDQSLGLAMQAQSVSHTGAIVGVIVGSLVVLLIITTVVVVRRRRGGKNSRRSIIRHTFVGESSPEEVHVRNMQVNGYENPTYKYFEPSRRV